MLERSIQIVETGKTNTQTKRILKIVEQLTEILERAQLFVINNV